MPGCGHRVNRGFAVPHYSRGIALVVKSPSLRDSLDRAIRIEPCVERKLVPADKLLEYPKEL